MRRCSPYKHAKSATRLLRAKRRKNEKPWAPLGRCAQLDDVMSDGRILLKGPFPYAATATSGRSPHTDAAVMSQGLWDVAPNRWLQ